MRGPGNAYCSILRPSQLRQVVPPGLWGSARRAQYGDRLSESPASLLACAARPWWCSWISFHFPHPAEWKKVVSWQPFSCPPPPAHMPCTLASSDLDANVPETSIDPSVPPPAFSEPSFPSTAINEDNPNNLCVCQSIPCNCLASKPLSPKRLVPKFKIKKTEDGWKTSHSLCENCDQPFLNSSHICGDDSDIDEIQSENMSGPCADQESLDCTCSDHERHKMLMKTCGVS